MSSSTPNCLRCRTAMEGGFLLDRGHGNSQNQAEWVEGEPEQRKIFGLPAGLKTSKDDILKVVTYRCPRCGMLESYAPPKSSSR